MPTRRELEAAVNEAKSGLARAKSALCEWEAIADNNVYDVLDEAEADVEKRLGNEAFNDCQGAYNCGEECYTQEFMVGAMRYRGTLTCEYNRHDKMYYYIESRVFTCECLTTSTDSSPITSASPPLSG